MTARMLRRLAICLTLALTTACADEAWVASDFAGQLVPDEQTLRQLGRHARVAEVAIDGGTTVIRFDTEGAMRLDTAAAPLYAIGPSGEWMRNGREMAQAPMESFRWARRRPTEVVDEGHRLVFRFSKSLRVAVEKDLTRFPPFFTNAPQPRQVDTLRVLAIGNSFTHDALAMMRALCDSAGVNQNRLGIYAAQIPAASLQEWCAVYASGQPVTISQMAGNIIMTTHGSLRVLLAQPWDVVVLQQVSTLSADYMTFNPWLRQLIGRIRTACPNPRVALAFQNTWSYWSGCGQKPCGESGFEAIQKALETQQRADGIDLILPIGRGIQQARHSVLNDAHDLTRDGRHLGYGLGRYLANCVWFQSLIAPAFDVALPERFTYICSPDERATSLFAPRDVTPELAAECKRLAQDVCR